MVTGADVRPVTLDIALFGRMVTSNAFADVEAAMQVAPAISTNKVMMESDYFTAMDDLLRGDTMEESGSGMGTSIMIPPATISMPRWTRMPCARI